MGKWKRNILYARKVRNLCYTIADESGDESPGRNICTALNRKYAFGFLLLNEFEE